MRDFRVVDKGDEKLIGLTNRDALYLTERETENIFEFTMLIGE